MPLDEKPTEDEHCEAESRIVSFSYHKPSDFKRKKCSVRLAQTDIMRASIQVIREGGENNLHYHSKVDGMFTVLNGRIRFYGPGDKVLGEYGKYEGVFIPRNARYWFESVGTEEAEVMLVQGFHQKGAELSGRTDVEPQKLHGSNPGSNDHFTADQTRPLA
jgi:mannose-6-phosphate isomerase-like protein (cupin superfamily)